MARFRGVPKPIYFRRKHGTTMFAAALWRNKIRTFWLCTHPPNDSDLHEVLSLENADTVRRLGTWLLTVADWIDAREPG
jgi:putative SOS response-associated peptidase YedK